MRAYLPFIDGLRAIAVLSVIIYHLNHHWLHGGFSGVDVFFVISGFVVSRSIRREAPSKLTRLALTFYTKRILRIAPALIACLLTTLLAVELFVPHAWLSSEIEQTGKAAFYGFSNVVLARSDNNYFFPKSEFNPFTHTWSLGVEEQFYLILPLLMYFWVIRLSACRKGIRLLTPVFILLMIGSLSSAAILTFSDRSLAFYSIGTRFWELGAGVALAHFFELPETGLHCLIQRRSREIQIASAALLFVAFCFVSARMMPFPGALVSVMGTLGILMVLSSNENDSGFISRFLNRPLMVSIGKISYSLYLWHWPVIVLFRWTLGLFYLWQYGVALALTFVLAIASYRFVEAPIRYSKSIKAWPRFVTLISSIALIIASYEFATAIINRRPEISLAQAERNPNLWYPDEAIDKVNSVGNSCRSQIVERSLPKGVEISFKRLSCSSSKGKQNLFTIGDSHAEAYLPLLRSINTEGHFDVHIYTRGFCPYLPLSANLQRLEERCSEFDRTVEVDILKAMKAGDIIFLPSLRLERITDQWGLDNSASSDFGKYPTKVEAATADIVKDAMAHLRPFLDKGAKVIFEAPKPIFLAPAFRCVDWFNKNNPTCASGLSVEKQAFLEYRQPIMDLLKSIESASDRISTWDPSPVLCPGSRCVAFSEGKPLFFDADHVSAYGNQLLIESFSRELEAVSAR